MQNNNSNNSNNDKPYTLRLTERQYNYLRHLWSSIDRDFVRDSNSEEWLQWGRDMVDALEEAAAEARKNKEKGE
jgi:hypothetical protein